MAGATTLSDLASAIGARSQESAVIAELKAGSEEAYVWLIREFHQPIYSLVYRIVNDPSDAADTTQEVFLKVFRGMRHFHGQSSLKTWIYRIALHEAANRRRWWFRHKAQETSIEPVEAEGSEFSLGEMSYEEISEVLQISLGTVKSRITRGRQALRKILAGYVREVGAEMGLLAPQEQEERQSDRIGHRSRGSREAEVTP